MAFTDRSAFAVAVVLYGFSTLHWIFLWQKGFRRDSHVSYAILGLGFCFHTLAMIKRGMTLNHCPISNLYEATAFVGWTLVTIYIAVGLWSRFRFLGAFASPVLFAIGIFALFPDLDKPAPRPEISRGLVSMHAALVLLAYGAFGLSCVAALMYLTQERNLKFNKLRALTSLLPPIQRLERIMGRAMVAGAILLTLGLSITGYLLRQKAAAEGAQGLFVTDAKVLWSFLVWCMYVGLLVMRWRLAHSGRKTAYGAIGAFAFVLLTFWGTNLLSRIHNT